MRINKTISLLAIVLGGSFGWGKAEAQTPPAPAPPLRPKTTISTKVSPVIVQGGVASPQVVTILHRLNGLKVFRLLLRSREQFGAITKLDEDFQISGDVHTNVIAGLTLDDGQTIAAWLPEAEAEMPPPPIPSAPRRPTAQDSSRQESSSRTKVKPAPVVGEIPAMSLMGLEGIPFHGNLLGPADLNIITREGKRLLGRYVGVDGLTGLSVISLASSSFPKMTDAKDQPISVGQKLRLIGPEPASHWEPGTRSAMYVRMGETEAIVISVNLSPSGGVARVNIKSAKLTPANIGGIVLNDGGETVGIVDAVQGTEATIVPVGVVRSAVKRVIERQASVPRPWLGIRGEPVRSLSLQKMMGVGWEMERARALAENREGIMLTSVAPGSPAALGQLNPGDVILRVNKEAVRNADEFSWMLRETAPGSFVQFDVARLGNLVPEAFEIKLSESPDPFFGARKLVGATVKSTAPAALLTHGIECVAIKPKVAMRFGAIGGMLVVYVQPETPAFKAGLLPGDVIEAIDGQRLISGYRNMTIPRKPGQSATFSIVRNKQKMTLKVAEK